MAGCEHECQARYVRSARAGRLARDVAVVGVCWIVVRDPPQCLGSNSSRRTNTRAGASGTRTSSRMLMHMVRRGA